MELEKVLLHRSVEKGTAISQITLDDDYNVPDYKPDIVKSLKESGELRFDEIKTSTGAVWIKGNLIFQMLYRSEKNNGKVSFLRGEIPFQEKLNLDGAVESEPVRVTGEIEDLNIGVINSRKLSVRAVVVFRAVTEKMEDEEITTGIPGGEGYEERIKTQEMLQLLLAKKDVCRQKSEIVLPSSKPNISEILWKSMELRNMTTHLENQEAVVLGEIVLAILYTEEEETGRIQWYETTVPLSGRIPCNYEGNDNIYKIRITPVSKEVEVKPDFEGEERMLTLEVVLDMEVRIWKEEKIQLLQDAYSLKKKAIPQWDEIVIPQLLVKNESQCRLTETISLGENREKILQICACEGKAVIETQEKTTAGILADGILEVEIIYITADDNMPVGTIKELYPFRQMVEMPESAADMTRELECDVEQLSAVMLDQEHIEVKAVIGINLIAIGEERHHNLCKIEEEPLEMEELLNRPGIVGYIAEDGETFWSIAKENHTTEALIRSRNPNLGEELKKGDKILIVKQITK